MYFMIKSFSNISLRDLDPEGMIRNEDLQGLKTLEIWYNEKAEKQRKREEAKSRTRANKSKR
jgi:hypothetical protein